MRKDTRVIILCGGNSSNWEGKKPRHFIKINGERLLDRTLRQLRESHVEDIVVVSSNYRVRGVKNYYAKTNPYQYGADRFLNSTNQWNKGGNTIIIYGDVYYTKEAMQQILSYRGANFKVFCRPQKSLHCDRGWGECFGVYITPQAHLKAIGKLQKLVSLCNDDKLWSANGFAWARLMAGVEDKQINTHMKELSTYSVINDITIGINCKQDYRELLKALRKGI